MNSLLTHLQWLDDQQPVMLNLVEELCNTNSGTTNLAGIAAVQAKLVREFSSLDGELTELDSETYVAVDDAGNSVEQKLGQMIHVSKWPSAKKRIMLCIHMDTVYQLDHPFQKCSMQDDGTLLGPGVADAKGGLVVMLNAIRTLEKSPLAGTIGWDVLINPDEEIGSPGSSSKIKQLAPTCDVGMLFEPALPDGTLVSWRKGSGNFSFVVRGKSAHAGREFENGRNAIVALSKLLTRISDLNTDPEVTYNAGRVSGGGPLNMVPDLAIGRVNVRVKTTEQQINVEEKFAELVSEFDQLDGNFVQHLNSCKSELRNAAVHSASKSNGEEPAAHVTATSSLRLAYPTLIRLAPAVETFTAPQNT
jgi:glutamate carboxypeptidase